jgi:hypothetical protein
MHAVAVVLDLVQPAAARRRLTNEARELRLDPFWWPKCRSHESSLASALALQAASKSYPKGVPRLSYGRPRAVPPREPARRTPCHGLPTLDGRAPAEVLEHGGLH